MINVEQIANNIYSACTDFDASDYAETKEQEQEALKESLKALEQEERHAVLLEALRVLFE